MTDVPDISARKDNFLRAARFQHPDWIPCKLGLLPASWQQYGKDLEELVLRYNRLFPDYTPGSYERHVEVQPNYRAGHATDAWGCVWDNIREGLAGAVVESPLADWRALESYQLPDPLAVDCWGRPVDWQAWRRQLMETRQAGGLAGADLEHGLMYMRLYYLRGFENFMMDVALREPKLYELRDLILDYNMVRIEKLLGLGAEIVYFADDLGHQRSLAIRPDQWRDLLKPCYQRMFGPCKEAGMLVCLHSDGHILEIIDDLCQCGLDIINAQVRANGLDGLRQAARGKLAIDLDLDRQLFPFASPAEIRGHILEAREALCSPEGGLMLAAECGPDVPLENIDAILAVLDEIGGPFP